MILSAFRRNSNDRNIRALYGAIVAQARSAAFYADYGVSDTVQGRFELIVLHLVLVLRRLGQEQGLSVTRASAQTPAQRLGQALFDLFCGDLDANLREMGVGDLAVPNKMRAFGEAFYGRQRAYRAALATAREEELEKALARNIFEVADADQRVARLASYTRAAAAQLDAAAENALIAGRLAFPAPEAFAET